VIHNFVPATCHSSIVARRHHPPGRESADIQHEPPVSGPQLVLGVKRPEHPPQLLHDAAAFPAEIRQLLD
jgi:hypothetical protein